MIDCCLSDVSALNRFSSLGECDLSGNSAIMVNTLPACLNHLLKLCLRRCDLIDLTRFVTFPVPEELNLSYNDTMNLDRIPRSFMKIPKIRISTFYLDAWGEINVLMAKKRFLPK